MEKQSNNQVERGTYTTPLGDFETLKLSTLKASDVHAGDRVFVTTESGNRYMFRRSKSAGGQIKVSNEKQGDFDNGVGYIFRLPTESGEVIGKVGEKLLIGLEVQGGIKPYTSTRVTGIEVRVGLDEAVESGAFERARAASGGGLIDELIRHANPKLGLNNNFDPSN